MNKRWIWTAVVGVLVTVGIAIVFTWTPWMNTTQALSKETVEKGVLEQYAGGEVISSELMDDFYLMSLKTQMGAYELKVDAQSGEIVSLKRTKAFMIDQQPGSVAEIKAPPDNHSSSLPIATASKKATVELLPNKHVSKQVTPIEGGLKTGASNSASPSAKSPKATNPQPEVSKILSSQEAAAAASQHVSGRVKDIELRQFGDSAYYLVEIETDNKIKGKRKADVQVNAITGAVMSVIWDDHNESNKQRSGDKDESYKK